MEYKPLGPHVLIELVPFEEKTKSGIILGSATELKREESGRCVGRIKSFGPTAYKGFAGCESPEDWGIQVGDLVELNERYSSKAPVWAYDRKEFKDLRIAIDSDIVMKIEGRLIYHSG